VNAPKLKQPAVCGPGPITASPRSARELARDLRVALDFTRIFAYELGADRDLVRARRLALDLGSALAEERDVDRVLSLVAKIGDAVNRTVAHEHALGCDPDRNLNEALSLTDTLSIAFTSARDYAASANGRRGPGRVVPSAAGLLAAAVRLLPAADRGRYDEEYRSELWDLAQAGAGRLGQLRYALCQLRNALPTSSALGLPPRRGAAP
jgi:hypothetical protein